MQPLKFIHTADVHLGSPLKSVGAVSGRMQERLQQATFTALNRIVDAAITYNVDFILFAGDVYDLESRSIKANRYLAQQLQRLNEAEIAAYIIAGNHDPIDSNSRDLLALPENTTIFGSEDVSTEEVKRDDQVIARIVGQSYRGQSDSRSMATYYTVDDASVWNIGLLHTALDPNNRNYVPVDLDKLVEKSDIHYWALGHIHQQRLVHPNNPVIAYPGNPQGRDVGETGLKGCLLVELEPNTEPVIQCIPTSSVLWMEKTISIESVADKLKTLDDLADYCLDQARELIDQPVKNPSDIDIASDWSQTEAIEGYIVRWKIEGRTEIHEQLVHDRIESADEITHQLREKLEHSTPFIWTESVQIETGKPIPDLASLTAESEIYSDLINLFEEVQQSDELYQDLLDQLGKIWDTKGDYESLDPQQFLAEEDVVNDMIEEAKRRVVESIYEYRKNL